MSSIDDFLSQLKSEYEQKPQLSSMNKPPQTNSPSDSQVDDFLTEMLGNFNDDREKEKSRAHEQPSDDLFSEVKSKFEQGKSPEVEQASDDLFSGVKSKFKQQQGKGNAAEGDYLRLQEKCCAGDYFFSEVTSKFKEKQAEGLKQHKPKTEIDEKVFSKIQTRFKQKQQAENRQNQEKNLAGIQQEELKRQREQKALMRQAEEFLKNLDVNSDEGLWFEEFAYSYESKLEAAMDYLKALG